MPNYFFTVREINLFIEKDLEYIIMALDSKTKKIRNVINDVKIKRGRQSCFLLFYENKRILIRYEGSSFYTRYYLRLFRLL